MRKFKTESKKLLDLMINSIYTNREIFLRELISNASDAEDKLYFRSLTDKSIKLKTDDLVIRVSFDEDARTVTVSDSGIGMTDEELEKNLGVIAHSDSYEFKQAQEAAAAESAAQAEGRAQGEEGDSVRAQDEEGGADADGEGESSAKVEGEDAGGENSDEANSEDTGAAAKGSASPSAVDIIGQFGVGFYSAFMVASRVRVVTKAYGSDQAYAWESDGVEGYTISEAEKDGHGTDVILTIKENEGDENYDTYLTEPGLKQLIRRYSNYVRYPVQMECMHQRKIEPEEGAPDDADPQWETYYETETINSMVPIWKRRKQDVKQEEYDEFYKSQFHDFADPVRTISVHAEGALSYDVLMFIPSRAPFDLYSKDYQKGLELYSSNVLIMDKCAELLPDYYNFVRGVVDSQDLTLNISRETLQHNSQLRAIGKKIESKITSELSKMRDSDRESYEQFFDNFGRGLKFGIYTSYGAQAHELAPLLLFYSAKQEKLVTLDEYLEAATDGQEAIYYAAGDDTGRLAKMPMVTSVTGRGYDVLLCTQDVDEFCLQTMMQYNEKPLLNVAGGDLGLESEADKEAAEAATEANADLFAAMKEALGDRVVKVAVSTRLTDAPAAITAQGPVSLEMEKIMSQMPDAEAAGIRSERVLELNASHPVFAVLQQAQENNDHDKLVKYTDILYNQALLVEGFPLEDPVAFTQAICDLMK